jgi:hypothetical protein
VTDLDEALAALAKINQQGLRAEIDNLRAIKTWALAQLGVDFKPGDRVVITSHEPSTTGGGWHHYREALAPGQTGIAGEITFNAHANRWQCLVGMDRSWSVHERQTFPPAADPIITRYWNGPADETPDGYEPPNAYDREPHPIGKIKHFAMDVRWIAPAAAAGLEAPHA